jgi:hypothetical protein
MPQRFIVRFRGSAPSKEIAQRLRTRPAINVIDETPRMLLVDADESDLLDLVQPGPDVVIVPERHYEPPRRGPSIEREPTKR